MFEADWWMIKINDEQEMISKDYTEGILSRSPHALESKWFSNTVKGKSMYIAVWQKGAV